MKVCHDVGFRCPCPERVADIATFVDADTRRCRRRVVVVVVAPTFGMTEYCRRVYRVVSVHDRRRSTCLPHSASYVCTVVGVDCRR
jgi:hypothetical protein